MSAPHDELPKATSDMGRSQGTYTYTRLNAPQVAARLAAIASPLTVNKTDSVTFQPSLSPNDRSQDRYAALEWNLTGGIWKFTLVLDGHAGHETADYALAELPKQIHTALASLLESNATPDFEDISILLRDEIAVADQRISDDIIGLFPGGEDALKTMSDEDIRAIINDDGPNSAKLLRGMRGTCVLITLQDPKNENLWVASLGDCQAVLGEQHSDGKWKATGLSSNHSGSDSREVARIREEHPGEDQAVTRDRVLGAIAVTRALGDMLFKLPPIWSSRLFLNSNPPFRVATPPELVISRVLTPPYLSNIADVRHVSFDSYKPRFLVAFTDGLIDLYDLPRDTVDELNDICVAVVGNGERSVNGALRLLRNAIGGDVPESGEDEYLDKASALLTIEMDGRWTDDTTIVVQWM